VSNLQRVLDRIPGFSGATVEQQLSDGPTNASYLLARAGQLFVLRIDKKAARELGLDRLNEQRVYQAVSVAGMAPAMVYSNLSEGIVVRPYLPGRSWTADDLASFAQLQRLGCLLRRLHGLPPVGTAFDPLGAARRYAGPMADTQPASHVEDLLRRMEQLAHDSKKFPGPAVLCHNDLVCQNVLEGESLALIDWEYAAIGDPFFDLAVVLQHHQLDDSAADVLLRSYFEREATADELSHLAQQRDFYQCLLELWRHKLGNGNG
jgi:thiamine kinase